MLEEKASYKYCIRLLSKRDYSVPKLKKKLYERKYEHDEIEELIEHLIERKWLREDLYIEARVKGLLRKNLSPNNVQLKMREEQVSVTIDYIEGIMAEFKIDGNEQILALIDKKARGKAVIEQDDKAKILRFLMSKGHEYGKCKNLLENYLSNSLQ